MQAGTRQNDAASGEFSSSGARIPAPVCFVFLVLAFVTPLLAMVKRMRRTCWSQNPESRNG